MEFFFGQFYLKYCEVEKAKTLFKKGLLKQQSSHQIWEALGDANYQLSLFSEAVQACKKAVELVGNDEHLKAQYLLKLNNLKVTH